MITNAKIVTAAVAAATAATVFQNILCESQQQYIYVTKKKLRDDAINIVEEKKEKKLTKTISKMFGACQLAFYESAEGINKFTFLQSSSQFNAYWIARFTKQLLPLHARRACWRACIKWNDIKFSIIVVA